MSLSGSKIHHGSEALEQAGTVLCYHTVKKIFEIKCFEMTPAINTFLIIISCTFI